MTKALVVDVDGTLCPVKGAGETYADMPPNREMIERLREYRAAGFRIIICSSRNMRTYSGNIGEINKHTLPVLIAWLDRNGVPFDEIHMGKPWAGSTGFYVDDRAIRPDEFLDCDLATLERKVAEGRERACRSAGAPRVGDAEDVP